jgi:hydrogenase maturation protease
MLYRKEQSVCVPLPQRISPHDPALVEALLFAEFSGSCPKQVLLVGVVPKTNELGCTLSQELRRAVEPAISAVLTELDRLGIHLKARASSAVPSIW